MQADSLPAELPGKPTSTPTPVQTHMCTHTSPHDLQILCVCAKLFQSCPTLCDPMDHSPSGSPVHENFQTRILEWFAMPFSGQSFQPRGELLSLASPALAGRFFTTSATQEAHLILHTQAQTHVHTHSCVHTHTIPDMPSDPH